MKKQSLFSVLVIFIILFINCSSDDDNSNQSVSPVKNSVLKATVDGQSWEAETCEGLWLQGSSPICVEGTGFIDGVLVKMTIVVDSNWTGNDWGGLGTYEIGPSIFDGKASVEIGTERYDVEMEDSGSITFNTVESETQISGVFTIKIYNESGDSIDLSQGQFNIINNGQ